MDNLKELIEKHIDLNRFLSFSKLIIIVVFFIFFLNVFASVFAKYESTTTSSAEASVAFFVTEAGNYSQNILLGQIVPGDSPTYSFYVSNNQDSKRCEVNLNYTITIKTTTNLPLTFELYKNETKGDSGATNIISTTTNYLDDDGTYYKRLNITQTGIFNYSENQTDVYNLVVNFPSSYKNNSDLYEGVIDLISIEVESKQVV